MADFVRVRDKRTGHEYSVRHVTKNHEVLDKKAVNANGKPLPAKPKTSIAKKAAAASSTTSQSSKSSGDEPADNPPEEGSK